MKTEKVFDSTRLNAGDVVWFSGFWTTIAAVRPDPYRRNEWRVEGTFPGQNRPVVFANFTPGKESTVFGWTRKIQ